MAVTAVETMAGTVPDERVIEGGGRVRLLTSMRELWHYRAIVFAFAARSTRLKYKQSMLGLGWAVVQPLAFVGLFTLTLGRFADVSGGGTSYAAFSLSAIVAWSFVNIAVALGSISVTNDAALIRKVYFPREATVIGAVLSAIIELSVSLVVFAVLGPFVGAHASWWWLAAIPLIVPLVLLVTGVTLVLAALNSYYRDVRYVIPFFQQLWLFASPVAYPLTVVPGRWQEWYVAVNPVAGLLDSFRHVLALGDAPDAAILGIGVAGSIVVFLVGYWLFKRMEPGIAEVV